MASASMPHHNAQQDHEWLYMIMPGCMQVCHAHDCPMQKHPTQACTGAQASLLPAAGFAHVQQLDVKQQRAIEVLQRGIV